jgi:hypothetical protein
MNGQKFQFFFGFFDALNATSNALDAAALVVPPPSLPFALSELIPLLIFSNFASFAHFLFYLFHTFT